MRLAVIADIHGNIDALDAVLADIARRQVDRIVCLGDHLSGPLAARRTADRLRERPDIACIAGNHDRYLLTVPPDRMGPSDRVAFDELDAAHLDWLRGLPATALVDDVFLCHGTPISDETYWLEQVAGERLQLRDRDAIEAIASADLPPAAAVASLLLCAHSHVPRVVRLSTGQTLMNPGSVGCPGYTDDSPVHVMQLGSPDARYAIAERAAAGWRIEQIAVPYDPAAMVALAEAANRPEWAAAVGQGWIA